MSIGSMRQEFTEAFDRLMAARTLCERIETIGNDALEHARAVLVLIARNRVTADGATVRDLEIGTLRIWADQETAKCCLGAAEKNAKECSSILSRLEVYSRTETGEIEVQKWSEKFSESIWYLTTSTGEIQAIQAQIEGSVAALQKLLPL